MYVVPPDQTYVACDWSTEAKEKCYDVDRAVSRFSMVAMVTK